jgi:pyruvate,orthophosphate dikinase
LPACLPACLPAYLPAPCRVYGNLNDNSGTGVCFTRNPANGARELYGEYLPNAQGEDVVAGIRTPLDVKHVSGRAE